MKGKGWKQWNLLKKSSRPPMVRPFIKYNVVLLNSELSFVAVEFMYCDLSSFKSIRRFVHNFKAKGIPLHLLINNGTAGNIQSKYSNKTNSYRVLSAPDHLCLQLASCCVRTGWLLMALKSTSEWTIWVTSTWPISCFLSSSLPVRSWYFAISMIFDCI